MDSVNAFFVRMSQFDAPSCLITLRNSAVRRSRRLRHRHVNLTKMLDFLIMHLVLVRLVQKRHFSLLYAEATIKNWMAKRLYYSRCKYCIICTRGSLSKLSVVSCLMRSFVVAFGECLELLNDQCRLSTNT